MYMEQPPSDTPDKKPVANPFSRTQEYSNEQDYGAREKEMRAEFEAAFGDMTRTMGRQEKEDAFLKWRRRQAEENLKKATKSS